MYMYGLSSHSQIKKYVIQSAAYWLQKALGPMSVNPVVSGFHRLFAHAHYNRSHDQSVVEVQSPT